MKLSALRYLWAQIWIKELTQDLDQRAERQKDLEAQLRLQLLSAAGHGVPASSSSVALVPPAAP